MDETPDESRSRRSRWRRWVRADGLSTGMLTALATVMLLNAVFQLFLRPASSSLSWFNVTLGVAMLVLAGVFGTALVRRALR